MMSRVIDFLENLRIDIEAPSSASGGNDDVDALPRKAGRHQRPRLVDAPARCACDLGADIEYCLAVCVSLFACVVSTCGSSINLAGPLIMMSVMVSSAIAAERPEPGAWSAISISTNSRCSAKSAESWFSRAAP